MLRWVKNPEKQCENLSLGFLGMKLTMPGVKEEEEAKRKEKVEQGTAFYTKAELEALTDEELMAYFDKINNISTSLGGGNAAMTCRMACRQVMRERGLVVQR